MGTNWKRGPTIGRGSTASVSIATTAAASGDLFAVKSTDLDSPSCSLLHKEKHILSQLSSPYIVTCLGSDTTVEDGDRVHYNLFMEYLPGGTLSDQIRARGGKLDEGTIRWYTRQMLHGLHHIHGKGFAHCDIKAQNVLITEDGSRLKIADFGCAKEAELSTSAFSGTPAYMAPEVARGEEQSFAADIWALGCLVIEMGSGCSNPWPNAKDPITVLYRIAHSNDIPEIPGWFSDKAKDFTKKCFVRNAKERWTVDQLLQHPFITCDEDDDVEESCLKKSPTSVADWRYWDDLDARDEMVDAGFSSADSECLVDRIRSLGSSDCLDWSTEEEDGEWVTVRDGDDDQERLRVAEDDDDGEIDRSFVWVEDDLSDYYCDDNDVIVNDVSSGNGVVILENNGSVKDDCVMKNIVDSDEYNGLIVFFTNSVHRSFIVFFAYFVHRGTIFCCLLFESS